MDNPLIYDFQTKNGNYYIYNANTNYTYPIDKVDIIVLQNFKKMSLNEMITLFNSEYSEIQIKNSYEKISNWIKYLPNFLSEKLDGNLDKMPSEKKYFQLLSNLDLLTLEVTQKCNLRCKYCTFSGGYKYYRTHNSKTMKWGTAKRAIDFYFNEILNSSQRTKNFDDITISFYGGEPLLEFKLIKKCVEYANQIMDKNNIRPSFNVTTNGTLLNDEIIRYLIKNKFQLLISLDGPKSEHDKHRVYNNGIGTFDKILKNMHLISNLDDNYYEKNVRFNSVYTPYTNLKNVINFFSSNNKLISRKITRIGAASTEENNFLQSIPSHQFDLFSKQFKELRTSYIKNKIKKVENFSLNCLFHQGYDRYKNRKIKRDIIFRCAACLPGTQRLFVDVDGAFHACERINSHFPIGDCWNGISYKKAKAIYEDFLSNICYNCQTCISYHFCDLCMAIVANDKTFKNNDQCKYTIQEFKTMLPGYFSILEENHNAFELKK